MPAFPAHSPDERRRFALTAQGAYFVLTGLWSLVSLGTFQAVTGPKTDAWLVKTVGVLVIVIGAVLAAGARRRTLHPETVALAAGSAAALAGIDVYYVARCRISPVYLLDAVAEAGFLALMARQSRHKRPLPPFYG